MTWVIFDPVSANVLRFDNSATKPDGDGVGEVAETVTAWPVKPSPWLIQRFRSGALVWEDGRNLDQAKADQWTAIKAARDLAEFGGFTWSGSTFDSDSESQSRIQGACQLATLAMLGSQPFSIDWTLSDNSVRTLSGADMIAVGQALGVHIEQAHATGRTLRAAIEAATTPAAVQAVTWPAT